MPRCVNIDWLEIYAEESIQRFPMNADYFRQRGYFVKEREYGTRQYNEMFSILNDRDVPIIEIRRNPCAGDSSFSGLNPQSCHIRLTNYACYLDDAVSMLRDFLSLHDYIFKRIYRIDLCYDFERFDSGDYPDRFVRRYLEGKYAKINQCKLAAHGEDNWSAFEWESLSWGARTSMVSTKLYDKTKELKVMGMKKPYIPYCWWVSGLVDDPIQLTKVNSVGETYQPSIWRLEFSLKSSADNWIVIEAQGGKRVKKKAIPHRLELFDSRDKLWSRFEELAYHYFRFAKYVPNVRKDRCPDKRLFEFNLDREFLQVGAIPQPAKPDRDENILERRLLVYKMSHMDVKIREACDVILNEIKRIKAKGMTTTRLNIDARAMQEAIAKKMKGDKRSALEIIAEIKELLLNEKIF